MKIVVDENIPFAAEALARLGRVMLYPGRAIGRDAVADADALIVRSITRVDRELLEGTRVRFVGTATIGTDHVDLSYLRSAGIAFADAAGSNARSVAEYVTAALLHLRGRGLLDLEGMRIGVIGVGHVGSIVARMAGVLGMIPLLNDPPRAAREPAFLSTPLAELRAARVITLHVPLTAAGPHPTRHLVDARFLARLPDGAIVINTARGGVVDSAALAGELAAGRLAAVLDVWEGEPAMPSGLLGSTLLATPHIAGYSFDGKVKGTMMMADALARFCGAEPGWNGKEHLPPAATIVPGPAGSPLDAVAEAVRTAYAITADDGRLRDALRLEEAERSAAFDHLRKRYPVRREFTAYAVTGAGDRAAQMLAALGFNAGSNVAGRP
jgi:erythronate-4-phosphate dehydrogenase